MMRLEDRSLLSALPLANVLPQSLWTGDMTCADFIGANHGMVRAGARFADGLVGPCFSFDGQNAHVSVPRVALPLGLTYAAWVKTISLDVLSTYPGDPALTVFGDSTNSVHNGFGLEDGLVCYKHYAQDTWQAVLGNTPVNDGQWHHIAVTHDAGTGAVTLYVDGQADGGGVIPYRSAYAATDRLGAGFQDLDVFDGLIDEAAVYDRPLSPDDIVLMYTEPTLGRDVAPVPSGPVGWWSGDGDFHDGVLAGQGRISYIERVALPSGLSFEAWVQTTSSDATSIYPGNPALTVIGDSTNSVHAGFGVHGGTVRYTHYAQETWQAVSGATLVNDGLWHHIAVTHEASTGAITLYVDGQVDGIGVIPYRSVYAAADRIGAGFMNWDAFDGLIDEAAVYDRALSSSEVLARFNLGIANKSTEAVAGWWSGSNPANLQVNFTLGAGRFGPAFRFDGTGSGIELGRIDLPAGLTFEAWILTTSADATSVYPGDPALPVFGDSTNSVHDGFGVHGGTVRYTHYAQGTWQAVSGSTAVNDGQWHHIAVTHDASTGAVRLYVDGQLDSTGLIPYRSTYAAVDRIGSSYLDWDVFDGLIDHAAVYDRVLADSDIADSYLAGSLNMPLPKPIRWQSGWHSGSAISRSSSAQGVFGQAFSFNGLAGAVPLSRIALPNGLSFTAWVNTTSQDASSTYAFDPALAVFGDSSNSMHVGFGLHGGVVRYMHYAQDTWQAVSGATLVNDGLWHQIAVTHDALTGAVVLYVDGQVEASGTIPYTAAFAAVDRLGCGYLGADVFAGLIDEAAVFDRPLTPEEISTTYIAGPSGTPVANPVHWWSQPDQSAVQTGSMFAQGRFGAAYSLGRSLRAVSFPRISLPSGLSFEAWVKTTSSDAASLYPGSPAQPVLGDSTNEVHVGFGIHGNTVRYTHYAQDTWQAVSGITPVNDGQWHYIAVTHDADTGCVTLYVDGEVDASGTIPYRSTYAGVDRIGASYLNWDTFDGLIDEPAVYARALTRSEIAENYGAGIRGTPCMLAREAFPSPSVSPNSVVDDFDSGSCYWQVYDYNGGHLGWGNVFYPVVWQDYGGVRNSPYVWADDSLWRIDTPEDPDSILSLIVYQSWKSSSNLDLRNATVSVYIRGDELDLKGGYLDFWVLGSTPGNTSRWHFSSRPLTISEGTWGPKQTFVLTCEPALWNLSWGGHPDQPPVSLDQVLANALSYGFAFVGFSEEVTGRLSIDQMQITLAAQ